MRAPGNDADRAVEPGVVERPDTTLFVRRVRVERPAPGAPPVLVLHGGPGLDHTVLAPWLDPLADAADLCYCDLRGQGRSAPVADADWGHVAHATWVDDCDAVRAAVGAERIVLFGHSYGGILALEYALRHPRSVGGLVLCTTQPAFDYADAALALARARATPAQWSLLLASLAEPPADDAALAASARALLPLYLHAPRPETLGLFDAVAFRAAPYRHAMARLLPALDLRPWLAEVRTPTLVLSGADDWFSPPAYAGDRLAAGVAGAEHVMFARSGHYPFAEEPARFRAVLRDWLTRQFGRGGGDEHGSAP